jgi:hypothetical protein
MIHGRNMLELMVADRIAVMPLEMKNISFAACASIKGKMEAKSGKTISILSKARVVPLSVARLIELQEKNFACIRPRPTQFLKLSIQRPEFLLEADLFAATRHSSLSICLLMIFSQFH